MPTEPGTHVGAGAGGGPHGLQPLGVAEQRRQFLGEPAPVTLGVGHQHRRPHAHQGFRVPGLVISWRSREGDEDGGAPRRQELGHAHRAGAGHAHVRRGIEVSHVILEGDDLVGDAVCCRVLGHSITTIASAPCECVEVPPASDVVDRPPSAA